MSILIGLLKIIGIILALVLIIICIIIFSSINVKVYFNKENKISYFIKLTYIFGLFTYSLNSDDNINNVKIFGINIQKFKKNKNKSKNKKPKKDKKIKENKVNRKIKNEIDKPITQNISTNDIDENIKNDNTENINNEDLKNNKKFKNKINNIKIKTKQILDKIKFIINYPNKKEILKLSLILLKRLIKAIKFKKIKININYGLDEPFKTGSFCGIISCIMAFLPKKHIKNIKIMPDFENQLFSGNFEIKCNTSLFKLLWPIIIFIIKKPIRKIIFSKGE